MIDGVPAGHMGPHDRRRIRGCFVPEERNGHGAVTTMTLAENAFLSGFLRHALVRFGVIDSKRTHAVADDIIKRFDVRTTGPKAEARSLSGGNLQKFLVGREVLQDPSVLIINQPTWGVDAGAALAIHEAIMALARQGAAVMIISQDLDEIFVLADRIAVIAGGQHFGTGADARRDDRVDRPPDGRHRDQRARQCQSRGRSCLKSSHAATNRNSGATPRPSWHWC